jgi:hypothetical protein
MMHILRKAVQFLLGGAGLLEGDCTIISVDLDQREPSFAKIIIVIAEVSVTS